MDEVIPGLYVSAPELVPFGPLDGDPGLPPHVRRALQSLSGISRLVRGVRSAARHRGRSVRRGP